MPFYVEEKVVWKLCMGLTVMSYYPCDIILHAGVPAYMLDWNTERLEAGNLGWRLLKPPGKQCGELNLG